MKRIPAEEWIGKAVKLTTPQRLYVDRWLPNLMKQYEERFTEYWEMINGRGGHFFRLPPGTLGIITEARKNDHGTQFTVAIPNPVTGRVAGHGFRVALWEDEFTTKLSSVEKKTIKRARESYLLRRCPDTLAAMERISATK